MTEPAFLQTTRAAYDTVATSYAELVGDALDDAPYDRAVLGLFAELVGAGPVGEIGCGTGRITRYLDSLGVDVFGVDLSPGMLEVARRAYPDLRFEVGSMLDLDLKDGELGGVVAWYSIIHTPPELLPVVFAEFHRVLAPGGLLQLAFQVGDERLRLEQAYGHTVSYDVYRNSPDRIAELLRGAGFVVQAQLVRERVEREKTPQAYLLAHR